MDIVETWYFQILVNFVGMADRQQFHHVVVASTITSKGYMIVVEGLILGQDTFI